MGGHAQGEEAGASVERLVDRHAEELLGLLVRRTRDAQLAADLTAETFAVALLAYRDGRSPPVASAAWLRATALEQLAEARRRGFVERSASRRLRLETIALTAADAARIDALGARRAATLWSLPRVPEPAIEFTPLLREQLRAAARRPLAPSRHRAAAAAIVGIVAVAALAAVLSTSAGGPDTARAGPGPRVVANLALADGLGRTAAVAFGSVWLSATNDEAVLRVDPRTRRVVARIPVGRDVNIGAGAGSVWAVPRRPTVERARLIRIDPRTNRVVARIPIPSPGARYPLGGAAVVAGPRVWVVGAMGLLGVDPRRNRPVRQVVLGGDYLVVGSLLRGRELWVTRADGSITRFDAVSGRRFGRLPWAAQSGIVIPDRDGAVNVGRRSVARVDDAGRTVWRTALGTLINDADVVGGRVVVEGADRARAPDSLWALDRRTGRVLGTVPVPGFSVTALLRVGGEAWLVTADGHVIVVAP